MNFFPGVIVSLRYYPECLREEGRREKAGEVSTPLLQGPEVKGLRGWACFLSFCGPLPAGSSQLGLLASGCTWAAVETIGQAIQVFSPPRLAIVPGTIYS